MSDCCTGGGVAPVPGAVATAPSRPPFRPPHAHRAVKGQQLVPGGVFAMGDPFDEGYDADGETPVHEVRLPPYLIDETAVTNAQFARFVRATDHVTEAE